MHRIISLHFLIFSFSIAIFGQDSNPDFYALDRIAQINIDFKQKNWPEYLDSMRLYGNGLLLANVTIDGHDYKNAGVRYQASRSFRLGEDRNALFIKLNYIHQNQNHQGYREIRLSNALRDPSMIREVLGYSIARNYMPAPQANYAKVYASEAYYGLMVNVEAVNDNFLEKHFGSIENSFFIGAPPMNERVETQDCKNNIFASLEYEESADCYLHNYEKLSKEGWDDLIELTRVLNNEVENVNTVLNVDQALWMLAFNNILVNLNSYSGQNSRNYFLYKDDNGRFNPIVSDLNYAFGSFKNTGLGSDLDLSGLQQLDPLLHEDNPAKPLISQLLKDEQYKKIYLSHLRNILFDHFVDGEYLQRGQELQKLIGPAFLEDPNKSYTQEEFSKSLATTIGEKSKIPGLMELMTKRARFLKKHPELSVIPPEISEVTVIRRERFSNKTVDKFQIQAKVDKRPKKVRLYYRLVGQPDYDMVFMMDDGKNQDGKIGDKIFGVVIDPGSANEIEFYIVAENPGSISFDPPDYMFKPRSANLEALNQ